MCAISGEKTAGIAGGSTNRSLCRIATGSRSRASVSGVPSRSLNHQHQPGELRKARKSPAPEHFLGVPVVSEGHEVDYRLHVAATKDAETTKEGWWERDSAENMVDILSLKELMNELEKSRDKLVIVDFYANWCSSCRALYPKLCKLARSHPEIVILKVNWSDNKALCKSLGIKALPFFHFYRGAEGRVEAFAASITKFKRLKDAIEVHNTPRCSLGPATISYNEFTSDPRDAGTNPSSSTKAGTKPSGNTVPGPLSPKKSLTKVPT